MEFELVFLLFTALGVFAAKEGRQSDDFSWGNYYDLQSSSLIYPTTHVSRNTTASSVIECGVFCNQDKDCLAVSFVAATGVCLLVNTTVSLTVLGQIGQSVEKCQTMIKETTCSESNGMTAAVTTTPETTSETAAQCTEPDVDYDYSHSVHDNHNCTTTNQTAVTAFLPFGDNRGIVFLENNTYVYCWSTYYLIRTGGYRCDPPRAISTIDPSGAFTTGPPDAAVEANGTYLMIKGPMVFQYRNSTIKPYIIQCNGTDCWANKTITDNFGAWFPEHPDAAFNYNNTLFVLKNDTIYQNSQPPKPIHNVFPKMPCGLTAVGRRRSTGYYIVYKYNKVMRVHGDDLQTLVDFGLTCFK